MAYTGTICSEAEINFMAGENVDGTGNTEAVHNFLMTQVEAFLCDLVKYDIVTNWGSLGAKTKAIFSEYASRFCAFSLIAYNMGGYTSRIEAEDMMNAHAWRMAIIEEILKKEDIQSFLGV